MDPLAPLVTSLRAEGRLRVWSLVITAFGDLVQHRGGSITTTRLGVLLARVGVEPGALRTALSRLGSDGWIARERTGRSSVCRLSRVGLDQFGPATSVIYAAPNRPPDGTWQVSVVLTEGGAQQVRLTPAGPDSRGHPVGQTDLRLSGRLEHVSSAYRAAYLDRPYRAALEALAGDLEALGSVGEPLDAAAARLLLIHRWRRIVLRFPEPYPELMPSDSPLADPRARVAEAYRALSCPTEAWLDTALPGAPAMPPADAAFANRFGLSSKA